MSDREWLVEAGAYVAAELDAAGYPKAGVVRQLARFAATAIPGDGHDDEDRCERCGGSVEQPSTGRRRKYCRDCSPPKTREKPTMGL